VDDLLDVTRISRNIIELKKECLEVNRLACQAVIDHQKHFSSRGIVLEFECEPDPVYIEADPVRISQILGNLLHNASKFSEKGDRVKLKVKLDRKHSEAVITVSDTGLGISQEILPEIFDPFIQADTSLNRENGGIGLGLAIVKGITELHGGSIDAASDGPGKGSKFSIRLPLSENIISCENQISKIKNRTGDSLRILIIEDNPDLLEILCDLLEALGHDAISAEDGPVGIKKAKEMKPDVILCDIGLPGISGYEVAEKIRGDEELKDTFMIALSGYAQQRDIERSKEAGFRRHLAKPVQLDVLKMALGEAAVTAGVN
jgi:CheY-like chemotaxis protein